MRLLCLLSSRVCPSCPLCPSCSCSASVINAAACRGAAARQCHSQGRSNNSVILGAKARSEVDGSIGGRRSAAQHARHAAPRPAGRLCLCQLRLRIYFDRRDGQAPPPVPDQVQGHLWSGRGNGAQGRQLAQVQQARHAGRVRSQPAAAGCKVVARLIKARNAGSWHMACLPGVSALHSNLHSLPLTLPAAMPPAAPPRKTSPAPSLLDRTISAPSHQLHPAAPDNVRIISHALQRNHAVCDVLHARHVRWREQRCWHTDRRNAAAVAH